MHPRSEVSIPADGALLEGDLTIPGEAAGVVVFAHGSGSSRHSPRNRRVAEALNDNRLAALPFDLLDSPRLGEQGALEEVELLARTWLLRWLPGGAGG